jgi:ABC-2 family transporter protein
MKYLAIFKDSIREAIDLKIFYLVVGLSVLVSLFVGTTSLKPVPMDNALDTFSAFLNFVTKNKSPEAAKLNIDEVKELEIANVVRTNEGTEPWNGEYKFTMKWHLWEPAPAKEPDDGKPAPVPPKRLKLTETAVQTVIAGFFAWFDRVRIERKSSDDPKIVEFEVTALAIKPAFRTRETWFHYPSLFFGLVPLSFVNFFTLNGIVGFMITYVVGYAGAGAAMLLSCVVTAFFIPSVLAKGTIDLLIVRPIHRPTLFACKFLGGMSFMLLNTAIIFVGIWLGIGLQTDLWLWSVLLCIPIYTFQFAIFYSVSVLVGVLTRSPIVCILVVIIVWALLTATGWCYWQLVEGARAQTDVESGTLVESTWYVAGAEAVHAVMPRYKDIDWLTARELRKEMLRPADLSKPGVTEAYEYQLKQLTKQYGTYTWPPALAASACFIAVMLGLAVWRFTARDY